MKKNIQILPKLWPRDSLPTDKKLTIKETSRLKIATVSFPTKNEPKIYNLNSDKSGTGLDRPTNFGYFLVPGEDGYWKDVLPDIELLA